ncbi:hypothetical protein N7488_007226 [Penicillium malachiteum]|nr:hypothetical protein N7488_007226 [Penicillium malachiteum]
MQLVMMLITKVLKKTTGEDNKKTEMFMTANRTVRTGLTASAVISSWLWSTALLGSSYVGYDYGVAGPFCFAAGCSPMIVFFSLLGISCKRKIPEARTSLEVVRIRYGRTAHIVFIILCLINNIFACANMLLGAAAVITAMYVIRENFVKAFSDDQVGSIGNLYDLLKAAAERHPVPGNQGGTYLTMTSKSGILFGILHTLGNFGLVIVNGYELLIKAFSSSPAAVVPGYTIGGIAHFAIPWALGTVMSSVALGLENQPNFPTYPRRMSTSEVSNGLVLPYAAMKIAGKGVAAASLLITFMACTSTLSAQVIAVSSILSFDVYREYFKKSATDRDLILSSHFGVIFFAAFSAAFSTMLHYVGIDLGWTLYMLGVVTCLGIFPMTFTILWRNQSKTAAIISPILGMATGIAVPQHYDWNDFKKEKLALEKLESDLTTAHHHEMPTEAGDSGLEDGGVRNATLDANELKRWGRIAAFWSIATFLGHWVLRSLPMYGSRYIFGKQFFVAWVVAGIIWLWGTMLIVIFYPLLDGGIQQIHQVYQGLTHRKTIGESHTSGYKESGATTSPSAASISDEIQEKKG